MREIKFRAWLKCANVMFNVENIFFKDKMVMLDKNYELGCCRDFDDVELMQFTGLHDKNGKEIFEGDIVNGNDPEGFKRLYVVTWSDVACAFFLKDMEDFTEWMSNVDVSEFEVIGNIYQNVIEDEDEYGWLCEVSGGEK